MLVPLVQGRGLQVLKNFLPILGVAQPIPRVVIPALPPQVGAYRWRGWLPRSPPLGLLVVETRAPLETMVARVVHLWFFDPPLAVLDRTLCVRL